MVQSHYGYDGVVVLDVGMTVTPIPMRIEFIWAMTMMGFLRL